MGYFSWKTSDRNKTIWNKSSKQTTETVYMIDNAGNQFMETNYEGYGEFGGKDFFVLAAEMNDFEGTFEEKRDEGIRIFFKEKNKPLPKLVTNKYSKYDDFSNSPLCDTQGFYKPECSRYSNARPRF